MRLLQKKSTNLSNNTRKLHVKQQKRWRQFDNRMAERAHVDDCEAQIIIPEDCPNITEIEFNVTDCFEKQGIQPSIAEDDVHQFEHNFIICLDSSRLIPDVKKAVHKLYLYEPNVTAGNRAILPPPMLLSDGIAEHPVDELCAEFKQILDKYCILYLRHYERHALGEAKLNTFEVFKEEGYLNKFGSVIDCVINNKFEIYNCDANTKAVDLILRFINRVRIHFHKSFSKDTNLQKAFSRFVEKLGFDIEIVEQEDNLFEEYSLRPVYVIGLEGWQSKKLEEKYRDKDNCYIIYLCKQVLSAKQQYLLNCVYSYKNGTYQFDVNENSMIRCLLEKGKNQHKTPFPETLSEQIGDIDTSYGMGATHPKVKSDKDEDPLLLDKPWRDIGKIDFKKNYSLNALKDEVQKLKLETKGSRMNIAVLGNVQAGKSSFINSVHSAFTDHVTDPAYAASSLDGVTSKYRQYRVGDKKCDHIRLCDTRGIEMNFGISSTDFTNLIKGHMKEGHTFDEKNPIQSGNTYFNDSPAFSDLMHCVCFVLDANKLHAHTDDEYRSVQEFLKYIGKEYDLRCVVLLTHSDEVCEVVAKDVSKMYYSKAIRDVVEQTVKKLGVDEKQIVPVVNYVKQTETSLPYNILVLLALRQMLRKCKQVNLN